MAPSKAPTEAERARRAAAWAAAQREFRTGLPAGTSETGAAARWRQLDWPDNGLRYWTAYDAAHPASTSVEPEPGPAPTADTAPAVPVALRNGEEVVTAERVVELNNAAQAYFADHLRPGTAAHDYMRGRVGQPVLDQGRWAIGYALAGWTNLTDHLCRGGATDAEIVTAGLGRRSSRGNVIDAFRDRIMFTVRDAGGQPVGFTGRDLSGDARAPKYVNTGGTPAYTKGDYLYGLHEAAPRGPLGPAIRSDRIRSRHSERAGVVAWFRRHASAPVAAGRRSEPARPG